MSHPDVETSCAVGAPLRMKKGSIEVATFQRKDDQQYTASKRVVETGLRCLDDPLHVAQSAQTAMIWRLFALTGKSNRPPVRGASSV